MIAMESQGQRIKKFLVSLDEVKVGRDLCQLSQSLQIPAQHWDQKMSKNDF